MDLKGITPCQYYTLIFGFTQALFLSADALVNHAGFFDRIFIQHIKAINYDFDMIGLEVLRGNLLELFMVGHKNTLLRIFSKAL